MSGQIEEHEFSPEGAPDISKINQPLLGLTAEQQDIRDDYKRI